MLHYLNIMMNNPFLSDRNIFSKVVNPLKKKQEEKKEDPKPAELPRLPEKPKEVLEDTYNPYKNDRLQNNPAPKPNPFASQTQKLTFGQPSQPERAERKVVNFRLSEQEESETQVYNYGRSEGIKLQNESAGFERFRAGAGRQQMVSPPQEHRFQEYRRHNNLQDCSPINPPRMGDSEFLNIDALGDDLNKFLAESKNQEELCKILGIERTNKRQQPRPTEMEKKESSGLGERGQNSRGYDQMPRNHYNQYGSKAENFAKPSAPMNSVQESNNYIPKVPAIFSKERRIDNARAEIHPAKHQEEPSPLKSSNEHIPTFNFGGIDQQHSTVSQEEEVVPTFSTKKQSKKQRQTKQPREELQPLEVFNYSKVVGGQSGGSLQGLIQRQMMELSMNGKYRTFLSASEKIVTVRYKCQPL